MLSGPWSRCISQDRTWKGLEKAGRPAPAQPRNLRRDVEDIFDQEVVGDAGLQGIKLLTPRSTQLIHRLQSPQDINVRHALSFLVITRFYVSPRKNRGDMFTFLRVFIPGVGHPPIQLTLTLIL